MEMDGVGWSWSIVDVPEFTGKAVGARAPNSARLYFVCRACITQYLKKKKNVPTLTNPHRTGLKCEKKSLRSASVEIIYERFATRRTNEDKLVWLMCVWVASLNSVANSGRIFGESMHLCWHWSLFAIGQSVDNGLPIRPSWRDRAKLFSAKSF